MPIRTPLRQSLQGKHKKGNLMMVTSRIRNRFTFSNDIGNLKKMPNLPLSTCPTMPKSPPAFNTLPKPSKPNGTKSQVQQFGPCTNFHSLEGKYCVAFLSGAVRVITNVTRRYTSCYCGLDLSVFARLTQNHIGCLKPFFNINHLAAPEPKSLNQPATVFTLLRSHRISEKLPCVVVQTRGNAPYQNLQQQETIFQLINSSISHIYIW